jgi:threonine dehydrogenase-like Zn-dependent dehydrogenase
MSAGTRTACLTGPRHVEVQESEAPDAGPGQVRVRLEGCGVCGSNLPVWEGRSWFHYPLEPGSPGHEGWGVIDRVGTGVEGWSVGERVATLSTHSFAEHDCAASDALVRLPSRLDGWAFPGEALACVMNIFRRSDIQPGQTVAIVGVGFLGACLTALATRAGARVVAISRRPFALETAARYGAASLVRLEDAAGAVREARRLVADRGYERVIECVGSQLALDVASQLTGTRARLIIAGYHQDGQRRVDLQQWNWLGLDVVNAHERDPAQYRRGLQEAIDLVSSGQFDPRPLFTHSFPLNEMGAAFEALAQRPDGFLKALVLFG